MLEGATQLQIQDINAVPGNSTSQFSVAAGFVLNPLRCRAFSLPSASATALAEAREYLVDVVGRQMLHHGSEHKTS